MRCCLKCLKRLKIEPMPAKCFDIWQIEVSSAGLVRDLDCCGAGGPSSLAVEGRLHDMLTIYTFLG
jgi:hypothetical protein